jgi:hypothetical protein
MLGGKARRSEGLGRQDPKNRLQEGVQVEKLVSGLDGEKSYF